MPLLPGVLHPLNGSWVCLPFQFGIVFERASISFAIAWE